MSEANVSAVNLAEANQLIGDLRQQLAHMHQQQELLLYTLSHDLRTPVMTILGFTDMLLCDLKEVSEEQLARQYLEHIRNSATRQGDLIENLLRLSRMSQQPLQVEVVDLTRIAFDYWQAQPELADNKHIAVKLQPTDTARGDRQLLTIVMHALLANAVKFTSKISAPAISFGVEHQEGMATYFVRDNGVGFNSQRADRLFHPFRRLHSSKEYEGLGMGLAICALAIQKHNGRIWVESAVDQGTTVYFTLGSV